MVDDRDGGLINGSVEVLIGPSPQGRVVLAWKQPMKQWHIDPANAFQIAEAMARCAHLVKFGEDPPSDEQYLASQIRARVTDDLRDRMVVRATLVVHQLIERKYSPGRAALEVVDIVLNMAQGKVV